MPPQKHGFFFENLLRIFYNSSHTEGVPGRKPPDIHLTEGAKPLHFGRRGNYTSRVGFKKRALPADGSHDSVDQPF